MYRIYKQTHFPSDFTSFLVFTAFSTINFGVMSILQLILCPKRSRMPNGLNLEVQESHHTAHDKILEGIS